MDEKSQYFHILNEEDQFILDDRVEINWIEILLYPTVIFLFLFFGTGNIIVAIPVTILVGVFYTILRYFAWFMYVEFTIDKKDNSIKLVKKFMSKVRSAEIIDKSFDVNKIEFIKQERSGKIKYLMIYKTYKRFDIMVIKNTEHKNLIESELKKIKTTPNKS